MSDQLLVPILCIRNFNSRQFSFRESIVDLLIQDLREERRFGFQRTFRNTMNSLKLLLWLLLYFKNFQKSSGKRTK